MPGGVRGQGLVPFLLDNFYLVTVLFVKRSKAVEKILFVCLGNICRSPAAEGVLNHFCKLEGLSVEIDSAGTSACHEGESADRRMRAHAKKREYQLNSISRGIDGKKDFVYFDLILAMDRSNFLHLLQICPDKYKGKIKMYCDFLQNRNETEVPDPYYGGEEGFEVVLDIIEDASRGILEYVRTSK